MKRRLVTVENVEITHQLAHAHMRRRVAKIPVQRTALVPLAPLGELLPHEQQLLAGIAPHQAVKGAQIGELLPVIAAHLGEHRPLAVHYLVMADRQDVVLAERIDQPEGHILMMMPPMHRLARHVLQRVVHEAHVPLEPEPEPTVMRRMGNARPRGRFLGNGEEAGMRGIDCAVHRLQKGCSFPIFATAGFVRDPFARLAAVVAVQHRCDRIDPQPVDMVALGPEQGVVDQKRRHLAAPEIVDRGVPIGVKAKPRVFMLVQGRAVEPGQSMRIGGEMRRHPIEQHADAGTMRAVDKTGKPLDIAEPGRWRIKPGGLISPGWIVGMLRHGQKFDVREAEFHDIGDQPVSQRVPGEKPAILVPVP